MEYYGRVYRPPSEAYSLIIQLTLGCSHNKCTFCGMYKGEQFKLRHLEDVIADLHEMRMYYRKVYRIFLADGDALCVANNKLLIILNTIKELFPECERIGIYGSAKDANRKSLEELKELKENGIGIVYLGAESGCQEVLTRVNKSENREGMISAIRKIEDAGIETSITFISGLGGQDMWEKHAIDSATLINESCPSYASLLSLHFTGREPMIKEIEDGSFKLLSPVEVLDETKLFLETINLKKTCVFRSNHASNYLVLKGNLPTDKERLIKQVDYAKQNPKILRTEYWRRYGLEL